MKDFPKKVLLLGSGALKIGEAGEFDYSGSQAIKALKEEGIQVILVNPNIATNQTSEGLADEVYFLPVTPYFVEKIIEKERPDAIMLAWGGQTALNCGSKLYHSGVLEKYNVRVCGTPVEVIDKTEDRKIFNACLEEIGVLYPKSFACTTEDEAWEAVKKMGYPVMVRAAFTLGGGGSGFAYNDQDFKELISKALSYAPQILVEESLKGWKEVEYEVVRDSVNNCITVCNMENFDPLGIHTGESIVVAPSQTLNNSEYQMLRTIALKTIRHLGVIGECNIQYALDPKSEEYRVIEVNARLSRSSALASKATGYPLAYVAAKLALGYTLPELKNSVTQVTTANFEPALDYMALKFPRWDLDKFKQVDQKISSEMKSVGEIMALGRSFEEVLQKGIRMLQIGAYGLSTTPFTFGSLDEELKNPTPKRVFAIAQAILKGYSVEKIQELTGIDPWFLQKIQNIVKTAEELKDKRESADLAQAKKFGFSDAEIGKFWGKDELEVREIRKSRGILPVVKQIDTLAAEFPAKTNYLYLTYHGRKSDSEILHKHDKKAIVLGSGAYCIGSSVEFDWCSVNAIETLQENGYETVMINYNPETVSTDYDNCDKLYFDELSLERVLDIYELENPDGVVLSTGGQVANNIAMKLKNNQMKVMGTDPASIHIAESRDKFSELCDQLGVDQPQWNAFASLKEAEEFSNRVGYPVLIRPSYVLSGAAMSVAHNAEELEAYLNKAAKISTEAPVVVSKFEVGAREIEIDAVGHQGELIIYAVTEHVENAGVHSGDATVVLPPQRLYLETMKRVKDIAKKLVKALNITGPLNIQFLAKDNDIKVIELNLRASRSFPFVSKTTGHNFIKIAVESMLGKVLPKVERKQKYQTFDLDHVCVKAPQFSFSRLKGADPILGVEMASTGEVGCFGETQEEAFLKSMLSVGFRLPQRSVYISAGRLEDKTDMIVVAKGFQKLGMKIYASQGTKLFLEEAGINDIIPVKKVSEEGENILDMLKSKVIDLVINIAKNYSRGELTDGYQIRRQAIDVNVPLITNVQIAKLLARAMNKYTMDDLKIEPWSRYK